MSSKTALHRSSPTKRSDKIRRQKVVQRQALMGGSKPNQAEMQKRLGNQGTQAWLAGQQVQTKLTVGQPGDKYEQEADRTAETVMRMPEPVKLGDEDSKVQTKPLSSELQRTSAVPVSAHTENPGVQRVCTDCEKELGGQSENNRVQKKEKNGEEAQVTPDIEASINALDGNGSPLPNSTRNYFEPRFGADFSQVRVHTGTQAAETSKSLNAKAFTVGNNIVFGRGQFAPNAHEGQRLMGHELTHVVQQGGGLSQINKPNNLDLTGSVSSAQRTHVVQMVGDVEDAILSSGGSGGGDPCFDLLQQIIELLDEVARRINNALDDKFDLFKHRPKGNPEYPDKGTWEGHRDRFKYDRDRLRQKIAEWDSNDDCRGYRLTREQQDELNEAREFGEKEFPEKPAKVTREMDYEPSFREKIAEALKKAGIPAWAAAGFIVLVIAALADPEPFTKVALLIGVAAAVLVFIIIGRQNDVPPNA